jgi:hypothetical protein
VIGMDKLQLLYSNTINTSEFGVIHQPSIKDIMELGEDKYNELLLPFMVTTDILLQELLEDNTKNFDLLFCNNPNKINEFLFCTKEGKSYLEILIDSLFFFFKKKIVIVPFHQAIVIEDKLLDRDNFDKLADIILQINFKTRFKYEETPKFQNERQKDVWIKLQKGRQKKAEKEALSMADLGNIISHGGKSYIPYSEVLNMTVYQFYNSYKTITAIDNYNREYEKYLAGEDPRELGINNHWTQQIKLM